MRCREDLYWEMNQMMGSFDSHLLCCPIQIVVGEKSCSFEGQEYPYLAEILSTVHDLVCVVMLLSQLSQLWCFCHSCDAFVTVVMLLSQLWCFCHSCDALSQLCLWCFCRSYDAGRLSLRPPIMGATTELQVNQGFADCLQCYIFCLIITVVVSANAMFDYILYFLFDYILYFLLDYNGCCFSQCNVWL